MRFWWLLAVAIGLGSFSTGTAEATIPPPVISSDIPGDADCDEVVRGDDAIDVLLYQLGIGLPPQCIWSANVKCDDGLDQNDARMILEFLAGLEPGADGCPAPGVEPQPTEFAGNGTIMATWWFDFESGQNIIDSNIADVDWDQVSETVRFLQVVGEATIAYIGYADFDMVTFMDIFSQEYTTGSIDDSNNVNNLFPAAVFGVRTQEGRYVKVNVIDHDQQTNALQIEWVLYSL